MIIIDNFNTRSSEFIGDLSAYIRENAGDNNETIARVRRNLAIAINEELTDRQREFVNMYYFEGKTVCEIADELGVNSSTVSRVLSYARKNLKKVLKYSF